LIILIRPKNGGKETPKEPLIGLHPVLKGPKRALPIGLRLPTVPERERVSGKVMKRGSTRGRFFELLPRVLMKGLNPCAITLTTCLVLLSLLSRATTILLNVRTESPLGGIPIPISALPKGKGVKMQFPCDVMHLGTIRMMRNIVNG
jgi:hypothetical protein